MAVDIASFKARFAEFSQDPDNSIQLVLDEAVQIHNIRELATLFCAAHLLVQNKGVDSGVIPSTEVTQRKVGPLGTSYITQAERGREAFFTTTSYGRRFLTLEKRSARASIGAIVAGR